mmetsp:Transcript_5692/g.8615  ORF Transcript_5692/g.8615 Transcript_5692/m.8615 type:complete len:288 (-) Transcript_5692:941-1804(-)
MVQHPLYLNFLDLCYDSGVVLEAGQDGDDFVAVKHGLQVPRTLQPVVLYGLCQGLIHSQHAQVSLDVAAVEHLAQAPVALAQVSAQPQQQRFTPQRARPTHHQTQLPPRQLNGWQWPMHGGVVHGVHAGHVLEQHRALLHEADLPQLAPAPLEVVPQDHVHHRPSPGQLARPLALLRARGRGVLQAVERPQEGGVQRHGPLVRVRSHGLGHAAQAAPSALQQGVHVGQVHQPRLVAVVLVVGLAGEVYLALLAPHVRPRHLDVLGGRGGEHRGTQAQVYDEVERHEG